jgi:hypothetical protein
MTLNDPDHPPNEEQKIDWFLDTVTEKTYESVHATCSDANIAGTLTFNKLVKLYTHKCFSRYPQFQISELVGNDKKSTVTNNSTTFGHRGSHGRQQWKGKGKGSPIHPQSRHQGPKGKGKRKGFSHTHNKGQGKGNKQGPGNRQKQKEPCAYCHKNGHEARECRKRLYDEKQGTLKKDQTNNAIHVHTIQVEDETSLLFQSATFTFTDDHQHTDLPDGGEENVSQEDQENTANETNESDTNEELNNNGQNTHLTTSEDPRSQQNEPGHLMIKEKQQDNATLQEWMGLSQKPSQDEILLALDPNYSRQDEEINDPDEDNNRTRKETNLLPVEREPPASKETFPQGNPTTRVDQAYKAHPLMELPTQGKENEDATSLLVRPPPGSDNRHPAHSEPKTDDKQESSSVNPSESQPIPWGTYKNDPIPVGSWGNPNYQPLSNPRYLSGHCSICEKPMGTLKPFPTWTCHECLQWVESNDIPKDNINKQVNVEKDDEEEFLFQGIPIAGENIGDSEDSWESDFFRNSEDSQESEHATDVPDRDHPYQMNQMATNYLAFTVGSVKDGIVKFHSLSPIPLTPNYYRHLPEITDSLLRYSSTYRWPSIGTSLPTRSQRLAHSWKLEKKENNKRIQLENDTLITQQALYITSVSTKTGTPLPLTIPGTPDQT